jgi:hypothetical protein
VDLQRAAVAATGRLTAAAAVFITSATTSGREIMITCEPSTSVMVAPARSAIERTTSVPAALSGDASTVQDGVEVEVIEVDSGPDARTGLTARVQRNGQTYDVALADLTFAADSQLGLIVAAHRRWQGRTP